MKLYSQLYDFKFHNMTKQNDVDDGDDDGDDDDDKNHATMMTSAQATFRLIRECTQPDDRIQNIYLTYL